MTHQKYHASTHPTILAVNDYNSIIDHGLTKAFSYIVRVNGSYYEGISGVDGTLDYGGEDDVGGATGTDKAQVQQACIDALEAGTGGTVWLKENELDGGVTYEDDILIIEHYQGRQKIYSNQGKFIGCPVLASDPNTSGWGASQEPFKWYNSTSHVFKFWDGSAIKTIPAAGGGAANIEAYSVTITAGNTSVVQAHTIGSTPKAVPSPTCDIGGRSCWATTDGSNVTVHIDSADPLDDFTFDVIVSA